MHNCLGPGFRSLVSVSLEWKVLDVRGLVLQTTAHCSASVGENIYVYGGTSAGTVSDDLLVFNTGLFVYIVLVLFIIE